MVSVALCCRWLWYSVAYSSVAYSSQLVGKDSLPRYTLFSALSGRERVTGSGCALVQSVLVSGGGTATVQHRRNIVLLSDCFPRPALNFTLNALPLLLSSSPLPLVWASLLYSISGILNSAPCGHYSGTFSASLPVHSLAHHKDRERREKEREESEQQQLGTGGCVRNI